MDSTPSATSAESSGANSQGGSSAGPMTGFQGMEQWDMKGDRMYLTLKKHFILEFKSKDYSQNFETNFPFGVRSKVIHTPYYLLNEEALATYMDGNELLRLLQCSQELKVEETEMGLCFGGSRTTFVAGQSEAAMANSNTAGMIQIIGNIQQLPPSHAESAIPTTPTTIYTNYGEWFTMLYGNQRIGDVDAVNGLLGSDMRPRLMTDGLCFIIARQRSQTDTVVPYANRHFTSIPLYKHVEQTWSTHAIGSTAGWKYKPTNGIIATGKDMLTHYPLKFAEMQRGHLYDEQYARKFALQVDTDNQDGALLDLNNRLSTYKYGEDAYAYTEIVGNILASLTTEGYNVKDMGTRMNCSRPIRAIGLVPILNDDGTIVNMTTTIAMCTKIVLSFKMTSPLTYGLASGLSLNQPAQSVVVDKFYEANVQGTAIHDSRGYGNGRSTQAVDSYPIVYMKEDDENYPEPEAVRGRPLKRKKKKNVKPRMFLPRNN